MADYATVLRDHVTFMSLYRSDLFAGISYPGFKP